MVKKIVALLVIILSIFELGQSIGSTVLAFILEVSIPYNLKISLTIFITLAVVGILWGLSVLRKREKTVAVCSYAYVFFAICYDVLIFVLGLEYKDISVINAILDIVFTWVIPIYLLIEIGLQVGRRKLSVN